MNHQKARYSIFKKTALIIFLSAFFSGDSFARSYSNWEFVEKVTFKITDKARKPVFEYLSSSDPDFNTYTEDQVYGDATIDKLGEYRDHLQAKDAEWIGTKQFASITLDYLVTPAADTFAAFGGPGGKVIGTSIGLISTYSSAALQANIGKFQSHQKAQLANYFEDVLFSDENGDRYFSTIENIVALDNPKSRDAEIKKFVGDLEKKFFKKNKEILDGDYDETAARSKLNSMITNFLSREVIENRIGLQITREEVQSNLEKIQKNAGNIELNNKNILALAAAQAASDKIFSKAFKATWNFQAQYAKATSESISVLDGKVNALLLREFTQMPPKDKLKALEKGGVLEHLSSKAKDEIREKWTDKAEIEEFAKNAKLVLTSAKTFARIAVSLGADPAILKPISNAMKIAEPAMNIAVGLIPPYNPMAIMNGISGLLGSGGPDPDEARHQQVVRMLKAILDGQKKLFDNQKRMLENQEIIIESIEGTKRQLVEIVKMVDGVNKQLRQISQQLHNIEDEIIYNRHLIVKVLQKDFLACSAIETEINGLKYLNDNSNSTNNHLQKLELLITDTYGYFDKCFSAYGELYTPFSTDSSAASTIFNIRNTYNSYHNNKVLDEIYNPMVQLTKEAWQSSQGQLFGYLSFPYENVNQIDKKIKSFNQPNKKLTHLENELKNRLSIDALMKSSKVLFTILPYKELYNAYKSGEDSPALAEIINLLNKVHYSTSIPVAQENLLSGEAVLSYLYENRNSFDKRRANEIGELFEKNSDFYENYLMYFAHRKSKELGKSMTDLILALNWQAAGQLRKYFGDFGFGFELKLTNSESLNKVLQEKLGKFSREVSIVEKEKNEILKAHDQTKQNNSHNYRISKADIDNFFTYLKEDIPKLKNYIRGYYLDKNPNDREEVIELIEKSRVQGIIQKFYAHPYEDTEKHRIFAKLQNLARKYLAEIKNIYKVINDVKNVQLVKNDSLFSFPNHHQLYEGKIKRSKRFSKAFHLHHEVKSQLRYYQFQSAILNSDDNDLKHLLIQNTKASVTAD